MKRGARNHDSSHREFARKLRNNMSVSEKVLWEMIRNDNLGFHFRRQVPIGDYFADFYCAEAKLIVEVDGEQHESTVIKDSIRDAYFESIGLVTVRIPSIELFEPTALTATRWIEQLIAVCEERSRRPQYLPNPKSRRASRA